MAHALGVAYLDCVAAECHGPVLAIATEGPSTARHTSFGQIWLSPYPLRDLRLEENHPQSACRPQRFAMKLVGSIAVPCLVPHEQEARQVSLAVRDPWPSAHLLV